MEKVAVVDTSRPERDRNLARLQVKRDKLINRVQKNFLALVVLYILVMIWIWFGVYLASGSSYLYLASIQFIPFLAASVFCFFLIPLVLPSNIFQQLRLPRNWTVNVFIVASVVLVLVHWYLLGGVPIISAFRSDDYVLVGMIRQNITHVTPLANYIPSLLIKSVFPLLLILLIRERRFMKFWIVALIGVIYAVSLMQKSYPLFVLMPAAFYCVVTRRLTRGVLLLLFSLLAIMIDWFAANPEIRPRPILSPIIARMEAALSEPRGGGQQLSNAPNAKPPVAEEALPKAGYSAAAGRNASASDSHEVMSGGVSPSAEQIVSTTFMGLSTRVIALPGEVVSKWFAAIPSGIPFERGCGYRFLAPILNCAFMDNAAELYRHYYPDLYARGYRGSMNAAHFAEEYANFGASGLILSGILVAVVLLFAATSCGSAGTIVTIALNLPFIAALGSTALHTTLLSGGWLSMMLWTFLLLR